MFRFEALRGYFINKKLILPMAIVIGFLVFLGIKIFSHKNTADQPVHYVVHLKADGITLDSQYKLAADVDKNGKISGGDIVNFSFSLTNKSSQASRYVTVKTGIPKDELIFLHNYRGTTGIAGVAPDIEFKNIVVLPGQTQTLSFDATTLMSASDYRMQVHPALVDASNSLVISGEQKTLLVAKSSNSPGQAAATGSVTGVKQ